ncbi:PREDICTED: uncharacterized protein LOC109359806 [Lupinus angustifolius]|uniref:uncharacterized protein LOC109359806 n=1 Tax=Lupinus angustifolius TaxID=3871 RepID=UPI00092E4F96|nr:PREDICTED: uncharacterized protein LOC109359806 [Lupinus angustifolius]
MTDRQSQQALSAQFKKKKNLQQFDRFNKENGKWNSRRKTDEEKPYHTGRGFPRNNSTDLSQEVESGNARKGNYKISGKKKKDNSRIQCFNCKRWGHFASEYKLRVKSKDVDASLAKEEDSDEEVLLMAEGEVADLELSTLDEMLLMVNTKGDHHYSSNSWYLDTGFSNHMFGNRGWFMNFDDSVKTKVRFADDSYIIAEGIGKVLLKKKDGSNSYISNVLYVPKMKNNLISLGQLLEKGYKMRMEDMMLKIFNKKNVLIMKAPFSHNMTFKIGINLGDNRCLETIAEETWTWHHRFGHLNFRSLEKLSQ